jgi:hypothetical protein
LDGDMNPGLPRPLDHHVEILLLLADAAVAGARGSLNKWASRGRPRIGATLKPGQDTPLWNALVAAVIPEVKRRGERARLARILELPRQRVTEMLRQRRHLPDAERTMILLLWLQARANIGRAGRRARIAPRPVA